MRGVLGGGGTDAEAWEEEWEEEWKEEWEDVAPTTSAAATAAGAFLRFRRRKGTDPPVPIRRST